MPKFIRTFVTYDNIYLISDEYPNPNAYKVVVALSQTGEVTCVYPERFRYNAQEAFVINPDISDEFYQTIFTTLEAEESLD